MKESAHWTHSRRDDGMSTVASLDVRRLFTHVKGARRQKGWVARWWVRIERWLAALQRRLVRWRRAGGGDRPNPSGR